MAPSKAKAKAIKAKGGSKKSGKSKSKLRKSVKKGKKSKSKISKVAGNAGNEVDIDQLSEIDEEMPESVSSGGDLYLAIRRFKTTIYLQARETTTLFELKKTVEGILKVKPNDQKLFQRGEQVNNGGKYKYKEMKILEKGQGSRLGSFGFTPELCPQDNPMPIGLAIRSQIGHDMESGDPSVKMGPFEKLNITPYTPMPQTSESFKVKQFEQKLREQNEKDVIPPPFLFAKLPERISKNTDKSSTKASKSKSQAKLAKSKSSKSKKSKN